MYGKGYGMPSSHAQFMTFFSISLTLFILLRHTAHSSAPLNSSSFTPFYQRLILSVCTLVIAAEVSASRIYLNYHTPRQVLVGCSMGALSAFAWFIVTWWIRKEGWIEWVLERKECRALRVRDLVVEEDLAEAGWREWESRRASRTVARGDEIVKKKNR